MKRALTCLWFCVSIALVIILSWPLAVVAQTDVGAPITPPSPEDAAPLFETRCANCHGSTGEGDGPQAVQVGLVVPDLTEPSVWRETTPARWFDIISNGVTGEAMPAFGEASSNPLSESDRWNLAFYLYTLATPEAQVAMGQALYQRDCSKCHGQDGAGIDNTP